MDDLSINSGLANRLWRVALWGSVVAILIAPLVAMQFTGEVHWTPFDFAVAAALLGATALALPLMALAFALGSVGLILMLAGPLGEELKRKYEAQGFVVLGFINYGARHLLAKEPLTTPASVKGKRIRVIQSPLHTELWSGLGAYPTPIPIPETYNALKTGVVDCMDLTKSAYVGFKLHEVVPYLIETGHIWATGVVAVSASFWKGLSAEDKAAFTAAAAEGAGYFDDLIIADEDASMAKTKAEAEAAGKTDAPDGAEGTEGATAGIGADGTAPLRIAVHEPVTLEQLEQPQTMDERIMAVRGFTRDNPARAALALRDMMKAEEQ